MSSFRKNQIPPTTSHRGETLTAYIRDDLRSHLSRGSWKPKLTLEGISSHYGVSATPVRRAVQELVREGVLLKTESGRLAPAARPVERTGRPRLRPPSSAADLERPVAEWVIRQSVAGETAYLREEATADRFSTSRSTVRRIFSSLRGAGMIVHVPRCGWKVRPFSERDAEEYLDAREVLELRALDLAWNALDAPTLERLLENNQPRGGEPRIDDDLHDYWVARANNRYIASFFAVHSPYYRALLNHATQAEAMAADMSQQHRSLLEAILGGKRRLAKKRLAEHIRGQRPNLERWVQSCRQTDVT